MMSYYIHTDSKQFFHDFFSLSFIIIFCWLILEKIMIQLKIFYSIHVIIHTSAPSFKKITKTKNKVQQFLSHIYEQYKKYKKKFFEKKQFYFNIEIKNLSDFLIQEILNSTKIHQGFRAIRAPSLEKI